MALLKRAEVKAPTLRKETVSVEALGGDVVVRGLLLSELIELRQLVQSRKTPTVGESPDQAAARAGAQICAITLAKTVCLADGEPLYSVNEWEVFGAQHPGQALELFNVSQRLSGQVAGAVEKN